MKLSPLLFVLASGQWVANNLQSSFMDELFGELVDREFVRSMPDATEDNGNWLKDNGKFLREAIFSAGEVEIARLVQNYMNELTQNHEGSYQASSHEAYRRYRSKINFPDKDDTSDFDVSIIGGISGFGHVPAKSCFHPSTFKDLIDIAIIGAPFDTGTSYRPGARFGPDGIRDAARRLTLPMDAFDNERANSQNLTIVDCSDVPMTPFDNRIALNQLYRGARSIYNHPSKVGKFPRIITLGGDHTITLMTIKAAYERFGKVHVIHFDSHIDTWDPAVLGGGITDYMSLNHGTFLHYAHENGYIKDDNFHVGIRAPMISRNYDLQHDKDCGFHIISARDLDKLGKEEILRRLKEKVGSEPVYLSVDIDVLDPAVAPGTGTMEVGGFSNRELIGLLDGLVGINLVGADVVEVSPPYDTNSGITCLSASAVVESFIRIMGANI